MSKHSSTFRSMALEFPKPDLARLRATYRARAFSVFVILFALGGLSAVGSATGWSFGPFPGGARGWENWAFMVLFAVPLTVLTVHATLLLLGIVGVRPVWFHRRRGTAWKRLGWGVEGIRGELPIRRIAAIQICSGMIHSAEEAYKTFEMNLVLSDPPGKRLYLVSHTDETALCQDAERLAEFLGVPLMDDSLPDLVRQIDPRPPI